MLAVLPADASNDLSRTFKRVNAYSSIGVARLRLFCLLEAMVADLWEGRLLRSHCPSLCTASPALIRSLASVSEASLIEAEGKGSF